MDKTFAEFLQDQIESHGLTPQKIARQTGISERHLRALLEGDRKKLPSAPYVRGYLTKIADLLDLNINSLWKIYQEEFPSLSSGPHDTLPLNRFAIRRISKKTVAMIIIVLVVSAYLIINAPRLFGRPTLTLAIPPSETTETTIETIVLTGRIDPGDKLVIDGQEIGVQASGAFEYPYHLEPGLNQVEFVVQRFLGREYRVVRQIIFSE